MPICTVENFNIKDEDKAEVFQDNEKVFCCKITKRIFKRYDDYYQHVMRINSVIWKCEVTGKGGFTYEEALESEKKAALKNSLKAPILLVVEATKQTSFKKLHLIVMKILRRRYFVNEIVRSGPRCEHKVMEVIPPSKVAPNNDAYVDPILLRYRLEPAAKKYKGKTIELSVPYDKLRRPRADLTVENLCKFLHDSTTRVDGIYTPKPEMYKKYVSKHGLTFDNTFCTTVSSIMQTLIRLDSIAQKVEDKSLPPTKKKVRELKSKSSQLTSTPQPTELTAAEKRAKLWERIDAECTTLLEKTDDLERNDQHLLPVFAPIQAYLPTKFLGSIFMVFEFMHSFADSLSSIEAFKNRISFAELTRAYSKREVVGPLSDILLILLGTIFSLQKEEEEECPVEYIYGGSQWRKYRETLRAMSEATGCHFYAKRHFSLKINELPLDATTLSEVLRLHFLSSGALTSERADKWRMLYRGGYTSREDPGLRFRLKNGKILLKLKTQPIYNLRFSEILQITKCLISQILTYSGTIANIEERMEEFVNARTELKNLLIVENRRITAVEMQRKKFKNEHNQQCMEEDIRNDEEKKRILSVKLDKKISKLLSDSDLMQRKYEDTIADLNAVIFKGLCYLGNDRAHRKYFALESVPGILIEHDEEILETCLDNPPINKPQSKLLNVSAMPRNRRDLRSYLMKKYTLEEKNGTSKENKENLENHANGTIHEELNGFKAAELTPTQQDLLMCSGVVNDCIVHTKNNKKRQRWSYVYKAEDIEQLINALNPLGMRESELREQLKTMHKFIDNHSEESFCLKDEASKKKFEQTMLQITSRKYPKPNFGLETETDMNEVMSFHLIGRILQFEYDIFKGDLGNLKVVDMEKWRKDLLEDEYQPQVQLHWGYGISHNGTINSEPNNNPSSAGSTVSEDNASEAGSDNPKENCHYAERPYRPPNDNVSNTIELNSEDDDPCDEIQVHVALNYSSDNAVKLQNRVHNLASALLQVEQAIERKFFKEPFGVSKKEINKDTLELKLRQGAEHLRQWEISLMHSTSFSQVLLHLNILHDCIQWARSTTRSSCIICRRGTDPEKMLLCDECNSGTHMFCMEPKLRTVPKGNWYCRRCVRNFGFINEQKKVQRKLKPKFAIEDMEAEGEKESDTELQEGTAISGIEETAFDDDEDANSDGAEQTLKGNENLSVTSTSSLEEELRRSSRCARIRIQAQAVKARKVESKDTESDADSDAITSDDDVNTNLCKLCKHDGSDVWCGRCAKYFHAECLNLRRAPRGEYICDICRKFQRTKRRKYNDESEDNDFDSDNYKPAIKKLRKSRASNNANNTQRNTVEYSSNRRSHRRTNESLPLDNVLLYTLLDSIMKNELAWPFLRPVSHAQVPDYHEIVKQPMDLATIKHKLNIGQYQLTEEVLNDIRLVFHNCYLYNDEDNDIYITGKNLECFVMQNCQDLKISYIPSELNVAST